MNKRAIVTGGAGFIGSNLVDKLMQEGWQVTVLDNLSAGHLNNIKHHGDKVTFVKGDILDRPLLARLIQEGDTIFHFAAMNSVPRSIEQPWETNDVNINGTLGILLAAKEAKARRVVYSGSSSAYGEAEQEIKDETIPACPISPYGLSKYVGEEYCRLFSFLYGLSTVTLRYFNVFGPRQNPTSPYSAVIPKFIAAMQADRPIIVFGDGEQSRDFTYVDNVVLANYLAATTEDIQPGSYNVACGDSISVNQVVEQLEAASGYHFVVDHQPERIGDIRSSKASIEKISQATGYQPAVQFEDGLKKTLEWYQANKDYFV